MNKRSLEIALNDAKNSLIEAIRDYVFEHGEEPDDYDYNQFGLDVDEDDGAKVTKVLNFFDNGGCFYNSIVRGVNSRVFDDIDDDNWYDKLYGEFEHVAIQCLYLVEKGDEEYFRYYCFYNGGVKWDDDQSEPLHENVENLNLEELKYIIRAIQEV